MSKAKRIRAGSDWDPFALAVGGELSALLSRLPVGELEDDTIPAGAQHAIGQGIELLDITLLETLQPYSVSADDSEYLHSVIRCAAKVGFLIALNRYSTELQAVPELATWHGKRKAGVIKGHETQTRKKSERHARIESMLAQGIEPKEIARQEKCSIATVYRALTPATSKPTKRSRSPRRR